MSDRGEPTWQPIAMLPTIAMLIDGSLSHAREHYATLLEARPKPHVLDDATIARVKRVNGESIEYCDVYDEQLRRWCTGALTSAQKGEVVRLEGANREWRALLTDILALAEELATGTIERELSKSDLQLGIEYVLRGHQAR